MPRFRVRVFVQCAPPGVTPDQDNALVTLPRRTLFELPPEIAALAARSGEVTVDDDSLDAPQLALAAARKLLPTESSFEVIPAAYAHREVDGAYVVTGGGSYTFILGRAQATSPTPFTVRQTHNLAPEGAPANAGRQSVRVEFRCHVVVDAV